MRNLTAKPSRTTWPDGSLRSPETGHTLRADTPHSLSDGTGRWPVVESIPFLRTGREELRAEVLAALDAGDEQAALVELLRDQDDWAPDPPPGRESIETLFDGEPPLREAMALLGFGPVADYFTYRLSDPTYLAGLALVAANWNAPRASFELACGVGHYSRELARRGVKTSAGDVVFAKLWLARRYVTSETRLVCFDAAATFPLPSGAADLVLCQDAFYFLPEKAHVARELSRVAGDGGTVLVGHAHNAAAENHSSGAPLTPECYAALFPDPLLYDDAGLTGAFFTGEPLEPKSAKDLRGSEAVCLTSGEESRAPAPDLTLPPPGTPLYPNPLYEISGGDPTRLRLRWPSARYRDEYAPHSGYLPEETSIPLETLRKAAAGAAGSDPEIDRLARGRLLLDVPEYPW